MENHRFVNFINKYWFYAFSLGYGLFIGLPFLAPVLMEFELTRLAKAIYTVYSFLCHQFPQRSFFLFGEKFMYSLTEIQNAWQVTNNPMVLRKFVGNPEMGWKIAWSDRMIFMYSSILIMAWIWYPFRKKLTSIPIWGLILLLTPMALDGITHMISDLAGIGQGFRDSNVWLAGFTNFSFSPEFYAGDKLGSFNSWMRVVSGIFFGIGLVFFGFPYFDEVFDNKVSRIEYKQTKLN
jgi:uncharacterized membrane protein